MDAEVDEEEVHVEDGRRENCEDELRGAVLRKGA